MFRQQACKGLYIRFAYTRQQGDGEAQVDQALNLVRVRILEWIFLNIELSIERRCVFLISNVTTNHHLVGGGRNLERSGKVTTKTPGDELFARPQLSLSSLPLSLPPSGLSILKANPSCGFSICSMLFMVSSQAPRR
jgi:hypothetical protein